MARKRIIFSILAALLATGSLAFAENPGLVEDNIINTLVRVGLLNTSLQPTTSFSNVTINSTGALNWKNRGKVISPVDGQFILSNNAGTGAFSIAAPDGSTAIFGHSDVSSDVAPGTAIFKSQDCYPQATVNISGAATFVAGSLGVRSFVINTASSCAGGTFQITVNGSAVNVVDGTDFTHSNTNNTEAANLGAAISAKTALVTTIVSTNTVYVYPTAAVWGCQLTATASGSSKNNGADGAVLVYGPNLSLVDSALNVVFQSNASGTLYTIGKWTRFNNVNTAGYGMGAIYAQANITAQSGANTITSYAVPAASDGDFEVSGTANVTAANSISTSLNCTYTDVSSASRTLLLIPTIIGTGDYTSSVTHIRVKAGTTITLLTASGTFSSVTYSASGVIKRTS